VGARLLRRRSRLWLRRRVMPSVSRSPAQLDEPVQAKALGTPRSCSSRSSAVGTPRWVMVMSVVPSLARGHSFRPGDAESGQQTSRGAWTSSKASVAAAQHARSLLHECVRRLPGAHRRRRIADRVYDGHRQRGAQLAAAGVRRTEAAAMRQPSFRSSPALAYLRWIAASTAGWGRATFRRGIAIRLLTRASQCCAPVRPPG
jgi:hypothetical protein